jgi:hypothetical protein
LAWFRKTENQGSKDVPSKMTTRSLALQ